jgi:large subunit ribosomal protein L15
MPHKLRKIRKTRGSRTQGYGRIGQHRDAGSKGNRKVGRHKHLWSKVVTYEPDYFGNHGFTSPQSLNKKENTLNLQKLVELAETNTSVDLTSMGYTKLLGAGRIARALTVTVPMCSKAAEEKIVQAGGKVVTDSQESGE